MATFNKCENKMVSCPYDPVHRMLESRLAHHIMKCRKNHPDKTHSECPFNASHVVETQHMKYHLNNCPSRAPVDKKLAANMDKNNIFKGATIVPPYSQSAVTQVVGEESWENEISAYPSPGYIPQEEPPKGGIVHDLGMMKRAERKKFYRNLYTQGEDDRKPDGENKSSEKKFAEENMRQPKQKFQDYSKENVQNVGIGRGAPKQDTRIAANIFSTGNSTDMRQPRTYQESVIHSMNNLQLGGFARGRGTPLYNENFPALGIGRGSRPAQKLDG